MIYAKPISTEWIHLEETESTNTFLHNRLEQANDNEAELIIVSTDYQTAGRGQRGNHWEAERAKNLLFSLLLHPTFVPIRQQFVLSQILSLSIKEELNRHANGFSIKWPNDIYYREQKICGILIEHTLQDGKIAATIAGVGLNVNQEVFVSSAPNPVSLKQIIGKDYPREELLQAIVQRFVGYYERLQEVPDADFSTAYHNSLFRVQGIHRFVDYNGEFAATIIKVEPDGILILQDTNEQVRRYAFKEVSFVI